MKKYFTLLLLVAVFANTYARQRVSFTISKPMCVLSFLQAANGTGSVAPSLTDFIQKNIPATDSVFHSIINDFSAIDLNNSYTFTAYPERRQRPKTIANAITIAAVHSATIDEMMERCIGIMPNEQWLKLKQVMLKALPYYNRLIAAPYADDITQQLSNLQKLTGKTDSIFNQLKHFYGSTWSDDIPFTISIYPVPGSRGSTSATPHSNSLVLAVLTGRHDYDMLAGIGVHEICHVFYDEQPLALQLKFDSLFTANTSPYSPYAYDFIDEALATACGNGWAYKAFSGHIDHTSWYDNEYINGYAHAIYPLVEEYIENNKQIDKAFINKAITIFSETFPDAISDYNNLFNHINLYTDAETTDQYNLVFTTINKHFKVTGCWGSYPISDPQTVDMIDKSKNTQVFIIYTNNEKNINFLKNKLPQLKDIQSGQYGLITFYDQKDRPVIIVNVKTIDEVNSALKKLAKSKKLDKTQLFTPL